MTDQSETARTAAGAIIVGAVICIVGILAPVSLKLSLFMVGLGFGMIYLAGRRI